MMEFKKWYAVYTRPRWEKKVADNLTRRKIENYCPLNRVTRQWSDRRKTVLEPLFSSYVFVRVTESEMKVLRQTDGIINMVYWLGKPAVIRETEITAIRQFLNEHSNVKLTKNLLNMNDQVRVLAGSLKEHEGVVISVRNRTIKVALPSLGYLMFAELDASNVELIPATVISVEQKMSYPLSAVSN